METINDNDSNIMLFWRARAVFERKCNEPGASEFLKQQQRSLYRLFSQILAVGDDEGIETVKAKVRDYLDRNSRL